MPRRAQAATPQVDDLPFEDAPASKFTAEEKAEFLADPGVKAELQKAIAEQVAAQVAGANAAAHPATETGFTHKRIGPRHTVLSWG